MSLTDPTPEEIAAIPEEHRMLIAAWVAMRAACVGHSLLMSPSQVAIVRSFLSGVAVDLADPLADDLTVTHAELTMRRIRGLTP